MSTQPDIAHAWAAALAADASLNTWCQDTFNKPLSVFLATLDGQSVEWGRSDCPYIAILPAGSRTGTSEREHEFDFLLHLAIEMDGYVEGVPWKEPKGFSLLEKEFAVRVLEALASTDFAPDGIAAESYPPAANYFEQVMAITVLVPFTIGGPAVRTIG